MRAALPALAVVGCVSYSSPPSIPDSAPIVDVAPDQAVCTEPPVTCFEANAATEQIGCTLAPVTSCDPELVRYRDCGAGQTSGGVMLFPNADDLNKTDIVYSTLAGTGIVSMAFKFKANPVNCTGVGASCDIDPASCASGNTAIRQWTVDAGAGQYTISVYQDSGSGPCNQAELIATFNATR